jgi:iron complex transport system permease protein
MTPTIAAGARKPGHITVRNRFVSVRINYRVLGFTAIAAVLLAIMMTWAMTLGSFSIPFADVVRSVFGRGSEDQEFVVRSLRLPRVISAVMIGAALSISGGIFQGMVRNPLVSPDIIGIESGASGAAVFWIVTGQKWSLLPLAAFLGAIGTAGAIYLLSWKGGIAADRLILVGIGIGAAVSAWTTFLTVRYPAEIVRPAYVWTVGSLYGNDWADVRLLLAFIAVGIPAAVVLMWPLRALQLGDDITRGLGLPLERVRLSLILLACALAAVSVCAAGPIGFVALMVPHMARMIAGPLSGSVLFFMGVLGALFLLTADVVGQHFMPVSLPVGVVTAVVGAPYFLFLLYRSNARI